MHLDRDAIAELELVDAAAELHHRAHVFVAEREVLMERQLAVDHRRQAVFQNFDVGGADRDRVDPQQHLGARPVAGTGLSTSDSSSGPPSTHAFIVSGIW